MAETTEKTIGDELRDAAKTLRETADARWIGLTSPLLAEPLASWLEKVAEWADETTDPVGGLAFHVACDGVVGQEVRRCECFDHPLAVARVLNGAAS